MAERDYKLEKHFGELCGHGVANPRWNDKESQEDSQGNSFAAGIKHSPDDGQFNRRKSWKKKRFERQSNTWSAMQKIKREKKSGQSTRLFIEKGHEIAMDTRSR